MATKKTISEYAAEQEALARQNQVASGDMTEKPAPYQASTAAKGSPMGTSAARMYEEWNRQAGVQQKDDIFGNITRGNYKQAAINAAYGAPGWAAARELLKGPRGVYMGGSQDALAANRNQYDAGILGGQGQNARGEGIAMAGADTLGTAAEMGMGTYGAGMGLAGLGMGIGSRALDAQGRSLTGALDTARTDIGSQAALQQQMANAAQTNTMMKTAAAARGGNAAAALRSATAQGASNQIATNNNLALLRMQEAKDRRDAQIQAQQFAAGVQGDNAQLGFGTAAQGLGVANNATGQVNNAGSGIGAIGGSIMGSGNTATSTFVNAEVEQNKSQLAADQATEEAKRKHKAGILGGISKAVGGMFGGGGGGIGGMFGG